MLPINYLLRHLNFPVFPLFCHAVGNSQDLSYLSNLYNIIPPDKFGRDLDWLLKYFTPLDLSQLIEYNKTGTLPGKGDFVHLSFDDGLISCKEVIAPMLKSKGIPATFFVNSGFIGNKNFLHRIKASYLINKVLNDPTGVLIEQFSGFLKENNQSIKLVSEKLLSYNFLDRNEIDELADFISVDVNKELEEITPYMSHEDIRSLIDDGFSIGAHSVSHPEFELLNEDEQLNETATSIEDIVNGFNLDYKVFSFPFTDVGIKKSFFERLEIMVKPDLTFGCSGLKIDSIPNNLHRMPFDDLNMDLPERMKTEMLHYKLKKQLGKHIFKRD